MQQPYDTTFKAFLEGREPILIPYLLPNTRYLAELNIEQLRAPLRADRVYRIEYEGNPAILHIEIEAVGGPEMARRMLEYHGILHKKYELPVVSMILYPFKTSMVQSPYKEFLGSKELLTFRFEVVALWEVDARQFVEQKVISMYSLLPAMKGVTADLLLQAIKELREAFEEAELSQQLLWTGASPAALAGGTAAC